MSFRSAKRQKHQKQQDVCSGPRSAHKFMSSQKVLILILPGPESETGAEGGRGFFFSDAGIFPTEVIHKPGWAPRARSKWCCCIHIHGRSAKNL